MTGAHLGDRGACRRRSRSATAAPREGGRRRGHADGRHHPRSVAAAFFAFSAYDLAGLFTTCFYAHGPDRTFLNRPYFQQHASTSTSADVHKALLTVLSALEERCLAGRLVGGV